MERTKDPMVVFRTTIRGKNSKGGDRIQLYIGGDKERGNEAIETLISVLQAQLDNPKGAKLDLHINKKEFQGRSFDSTFGFVKAVDSGAGAPGAGGKMVSKPKGTDTEAKINAFKASVVKG